MSLRQQAVRGVVWSSVQNWGSLAIGTLAFLVLARLLEPADFGLFAMSAVFTALVDMLLRQGFGQAIVQRSDLDRAHLDTAFWYSVGNGVFLMLVAWGVAGWLAVLFREPQVAPVVRWVSISFVLGGLSTTHQAILQRDMAFKSLALRAILSTLAGGIVGIAMAVGGKGVWSLVGQFVSASAVGAVVLWWKSPYRPGLDVRWRHFKELFAFGISVLGAAVLGVVNRRSDAFLIGYFLGVEALGFYNVAQRLLIALTQAITQSVSLVAFPTFSRLQHKPEQMRSALLTATRMTALVAFPAFAGMACLADLLVAALFGSGWEAAIPVMRILSMYGIVQTVTFFNHQVLLAMGKPSWRLGIMIVSVVVGVAALLVAVRWGIVVVAGAMVAQAVLLTPLLLWAVGKLIALHPITYLRQVLAPTVGSVVMVVAVIAVRRFAESSLSLPAALAIDIVVGGLVYVGAMRLLSPSLTREAIDLVRVAMPRRRDAVNSVDSHP